MSENSLVGNHIPPQAPRPVYKKTPSLPAHTPAASLPEHMRERSPTHAGAYPAERQELAGGL
jgi:hypothetical protein